MSEEGVDQRARQEAVEDSESKRCAGIGRLQQALQRAGRELAAETQRGAVEAPEVAEELQADEEHEKAVDDGKAAMRQEQGLVVARTGSQPRTQRAGKGAEEHVVSDPAAVRETLEKQGVWSAARPGDQRDGASPTHNDAHPD